MEKAEAEVEALSDGESSEDSESSSEEEEEEEEEYTIQPSQDMTTWERVKVQTTQREMISDGSDEENTVEPVKPVKKAELKHESEDELEVVPKKEVITITEKDVDEVMKPVEEKMKSTIFYYWPVMPQATFPRWEVKNAVM